MKSSMIVHPDELSKDWIDRLADAGISTIGLHPCGGDEAFDCLVNLMERLQTKEYRDLIDYAHARGLSVEYEFHGMGYLLRRNLFAAHPEYFRINQEGERTSDYNMCVSNDEALDVVAKAAVTLAKSLYGTTHNFYFWLDDGHSRYCHCPKCKDLSPSDQQLIVLNKMLKEIRKEIPDAKMAFLAYMDTLEPPTKVKADDGIFLEYAPFKKYIAKGEEAPPLIAHEAAMISPLVETFKDKEKKVLEYWYDNSLFSRWKKPPQKFELDRELLFSDIPKYKEAGFNYMSTFACFLGKDYEDLYGKVDVSEFGKALKQTEKR